MNILPTPFCLPHSVYPILFTLFSDHGHSDVHWGRTKSLTILLVATTLTSLCAEIVVNNIEALMSGSNITIVSE